MPLERLRIASCRLHSRSLIGATLFHTLTMDKPNYAEKLKDPRWQKKRLEIFQRDKWKCTKCKDHKTELQVHHLEYKGNPWDVSNDKLETLCKDCHSIISEYKMPNDVQKVMKLKTDSDPENPLCFFIRKDSIHIIKSGQKDFSLNFTKDGFNSIIKFING